VSNDAGCIPEIALPRWREWLEQHASNVALSESEYQLHLAAIEWSLPTPLAINRREDFWSIPKLKVEPFEHQVDDAILFLRRLAPRGLIADDVGLGKTITAGLIATELIQRGHVGSMLVVCPRSLVDQWRAELLGKFGLDAVSAIGGAEFRDLDRAPFWVTTYQTARSQIEEIHKRSFDLLILDEAHILRNFIPNRPLVAEAFYDLLRRDGARMVLMLTATPIQTRLWDIYSLAKILRAPQPNPLGSQGEFRDRFIADSNSARRLVPGMETEFRRIVSEFSIRKSRRDTKIPFPERIVRDFVVQPLAEEQAFFDRALPVIMTFPPQVQSNYARSLLSSPWALAESLEREAAKTGYSHELRSTLARLAEEGRAVSRSAKIEQVLQLVRESAREGRAERVIVFTMRRATLRHLAAALETEGFGDQIGIIEGNAPEVNGKAIAGFTTEPATLPILLSTDAGGVGLNLQAGNIVVNYDLPWNPMTLEQRIGRVQRLGQTAANVVVQNLILAGTLEERVVLRLMERLKLFDQAIGGMEALLEQCEFDEDRSLEQIILELLRKAAQKKDIAKDLEQMEASRRRAEAKLAEMREATDQILSTIVPNDQGLRLEGLQRPSPRAPREAVLQAARARRQNPTGREHEFQAVERRSFDRLLAPLREGAVHRVFDATGIPPSQIEARLAEHFGVLGMVVDRIKIGTREAVLAGKAACVAKVEVGIDRYETLVETQHWDASDGVQAYLESEHPTDAEGTPLAPVPAASVPRLAPSLDALGRTWADAAARDANIDKFVTFYESRYREDVERLARAIRGARGVGSSEDCEWIVEDAARTNKATRMALASIQARFRPSMRLVPAGVAGLLYEHVEVEAWVRNRAQKRAAPIHIVLVPLTGVLRTEIKCTARASGSRDAWACAGGHLCQVDEFEVCAATGCGRGACETCARDSNGKGALGRCAECERLFCPSHRLVCTLCHATLCKADAKFDSRGLRACTGCRSKSAGVEAKRVPAPVEEAVPATAGEEAEAAAAEVRHDETAAPEASAEFVLCTETGRRVSRNLVIACPETGRVLLRSAAVRCEASGDYLAPEAAEVCEATGKTVRRSLLALDQATGKRVQEALLIACEVTGLRTTIDGMVRSAVSGRLVLARLATHCAETGAAALPDELVTCTATKRCVLPGLAKTKVVQPEPAELRMPAPAEPSPSPPVVSHELPRGSLTELAVALGRCEICEEAKERSSLRSCRLCRVPTCGADRRYGICRLCAELLAGRGDDLPSREVQALRKRHSWLRRGTKIESSSAIRVWARKGMLSLGKIDALLLLRQRAADRLIEVTNTQLSDDIIRDAGKAWKELGPKR